MRSNTRSARLHRGVSIFIAFLDRAGREMMTAISGYHHASRISAREIGQILMQRQDCSVGKLELVPIWQGESAWRRERTVQLDQKHDGATLIWVDKALAQKGPAFWSDAANDWVARHPARTVAPRSDRRRMPREAGCFPHLARDVARFRRENRPEESVFVMMKLPRRGPGTRWQDRLLNTLFTTIEKELQRHGLRCCRADLKLYATSQQLWDNVCVYMLGCRFGLAVLEDHTGNELNPNVALEYGFMKALGCQVVLLKERTFKHIRADLVGTVPKEFTIRKASHQLDVASVKRGVSAWLHEIGLAKRSRQVQTSGISRPA